MVRFLNWHLFPLPGLVCSKVYPGKKDELARLSAGAARGESFDSAPAPEKLQRLTRLRSASADCAERRACSALNEWAEPNSRTEIAPEKDVASQGLRDADLLAARIG